jgi:hypothetical protein
MTLRTRRATPHDEIVVASWRDFEATVLNARYTNWAFRGHRDAQWQLTSTLARRLDTGHVARDHWVAQERRIVRIFMRKAHLFLDHIPDDDDTFRWLALMQHHGAPTRLLDFTWSPYIAAFFALEDATKPAAIWAINPTALFRPVTLRLDGRRRMVTPGALGPWVRGNFERYFLPNKHRFVTYGEPSVMNQRLIAQSGTFVIPSTLGLPVDEILAKGPAPRDAMVKFVLQTRDVRDKLLLQLYSMNITYYSLFPGLDGLARSMGYESEYNWEFDPRKARRKGRSSTEEGAL